MEKKKMRGKCRFCLHLVLFLSLIVITATANLSPVYASPTALLVYPPTIIDINKTPGATFTVNVNVDDVEHLFGFDFRLLFDPTVLHATKITLGDFFGGPETIGPAPGGPSIIWYNEINNITGYVWYAVTLGNLSPDYTTGLSGSGTLAIIEFIVKDVGITLLDLIDTELRNAQAQKIPYDVFVGYFSNTGYASPIAGFTFTPASPILGETVTFNATYDPSTGSGSRDLDGYIVSWDWDFGDGSSGSGKIMEHIYTEVGNLGPEGLYYTTVTLTVTDNSSLTGTAKRDVILSGHNIAVIDVQPNQTFVMQNQTISIGVTVKNKGSETEAKSFNVTACYNGIPVAPPQTTLISPKYNKTLTFRWNTSGVAEGTYTISANASQVEGEDILDDNLLTDDTVTVVLTEVHDIAVTKVIPSPTMVFIGDKVNIDVTVVNQGLLQETFNASVCYDGKPIKTQIGIILNASKSQTLTFTWDTTGVASGLYYSISANVSTVLDEMNTANNNLTDGTVGVALHNTKVSSLSVPTSSVVGTTLTIEAILKNEGRQNATFTVSFYYDNTWITNRTVGDLTPSATTSLTVLWDTTSVAAGPHTIKVKVPQLEGELVVTDNERTQGVSLVPKVHNIAVTGVTANPTTVIRGKTVDINITVQNLGNVDETFSASVSYDTTLIETETDVTLTVGESKTLNFKWNTPADITLKTYTIEAKAQIPEDTDATDNTKTTQVTIAIHDITTVSVSASKTEVAVGESVALTVVVKNQGNFTESFSVAAKYGDNPIGTPINVNNLAKGQPQTFTFTWNTTGVSPGTYKIKASASAVSDEEDTTNNIQEDGTVTVKQRSTVLISATPNPITVGAEITVRGSISPTHAGMTVTIWYRRVGASAWNNLTATQTNTNSQYSCTWTPPAAGTYEVKASWEGDQDTQSGESTTFNVTVDESPEGTHLYLIIAIGVLIIIAIGVVAYYLIRKKP